MKTPRIYRYICALLFSGVVMQVGAMCLPNDSVKQKSTRVFASREEARKALKKYNGMPLFNGFAVGADLVGPMMKGLVSWRQYEVMGRLNLYKTYFPTVEIGMGKADHTNDDTSVNYQVNAPYYRVGVDVNFLKSKEARNFILGGVRYGFSTYDYSINGPNVVDPHWGTVLPYSMNDLNGSKHWLEIVFGLETRIWKIIHMGWNFKYKFGLSESASPVGKPWYVPGYGENKNGTIGASFNLIIDFSRF